VIRRPLLLTLSSVVLAATGPAFAANAQPTANTSCRVDGALRTGSSNPLRCTLSARGKLRWRSISAVPSVPATTVTTAVAPLLLSVGASWDRGVTVEWLAGTPSQGVTALQWSTEPSFERYDVIRASGTTTTISADWFAANTTYFVRIFEMLSSWQRGPHSTENLTSHSNVLSFRLGDRPTGPAARVYVWSQRGADIDGTADNETFGSSVSVSDDGSVVAVGSPNGGVGGQGQVRVFTWNGTTWSQRGTTLTGLVNGHRLGEAVALSGDGTHLAMGSPGVMVGSDTVGRVYVYRWTGATWTSRGNALQGTVDEGDWGRAVALSRDGSRLALGAPSVGNGEVRIFESPGVSSDYVAMGSALSSVTSGDFGRSVALSADGSFVAAGAPYATLGKGFAEVYSWTGAAWTQVGARLTPAADNAGWFGLSLAMSDDATHLAVGAPSAPGGGTERGATYVYSRSGTTWTQRGSAQTGYANNDQSGYSVDISDDGNVVASGARLDDRGGNDGGSTAVYRWNSESSRWALETTFIGESADDTSGYSVAMSGDGSLVVAGARYNEGGGYQRGHVRIFFAT
jgi:hypothetical protein